MIQTNQTEGLLLQIIVAALGSTALVTGSIALLKRIVAGFQARERRLRESEDELRRAERSEILADKERAFKILEAQVADLQGQIREMRTEFNTARERWEVEESAISHDKRNAETRAGIAETLLEECREARKIDLARIAKLEIRVGELERKNSH